MEPDALESSHEVGETAIDNVSDEVALSDVVANCECVFAFDVEVPEGHTCKSHAHRATEFVFCHGCEGTATIGEQPFGYHDGSVLVHQPDTPHFVSNRVGGVQTCIGLTGSMSQWIRPGVYESGSRIDSLVEQLRECLHRDRRLDEERLDHYCGLLAVELVESTSGDQPEPSRAELVRELIETDFAHDWDLAKLAEAVYVSPNYLRQMFRDEFGEPVIHYLIRRRLDHARVLVEQTVQSLGEIAETCGFRDQSYFSRVFKKRFGQSPLHHRNEVRDQKPGINV